MAKKIVNSDIYNVSQLVDDLKREFIPEETDATLAMGTLGYIGAIESKRLQTQVIMTGELCNESFPSRARLERNVITHAITSNIENINAIPAKMDVILGIRQSDIDSLMENETFVIDRECPIYVEEFEFHLEYDIIIKRVTISGNEKVYTAQYDISRDNPSSDIVNPYISSPAVIIINTDTYVFINVILSQVEHNTEYKKLVTSNIIDNKTINFSFQNQLAYFEVHVTEVNEDVYLTPIFEGSGVPDGVAFYCWYQYINTDMIRVRFDRNSYMPGLNSEIEIMIKTTRGKEGNIEYKSDIYINLESEKYGYKNISVLLKPVSSSSDGKNRKSKKELQSLIPKEALARGSLTTAKDLNNYFGMIDSEEGRIIIQKKIDNQRERIYYAYLILKDDNGNIIPSNTIDLRIPMNEMISTTISDSASPRYVLRSGACIHLTNDNITGEIVQTPIKNLGIYWNSVDIPVNKKVSLTFKASILSSDYPAVNCRALLGDVSSAFIESPLTANEIYAYDNKSQIEDVTFGKMVSSGQLLKFSIPYTAAHDGDIDIKYTIHEAFDYIADTAVYEKDDDRVPIKIDPTISPNLMEFKIENAEKDSLYTIEFNARVNEKAEALMENNAEITNVSDVVNIPMNLHGLVLSIESNPVDLLIGNLLTYTISFVSNDNMSFPTIAAELSRGLSYVVKSTKLTITDMDDTNKKEYIFEPRTEDLVMAAGFLYTNPYSIVINHYKLYSAFYMMCVNISPYVHFEYINQRSTIQFIATNVYWNRPFLGYYKNTYSINMAISQSVAKDMGLIVYDPNNSEVITDINVKLIALFYRDGKPYRYKNLESTYVDASTFTFEFGAEFSALDLLDQDNNIKVDNMGLLNQYDEEYGYFNPNTKLIVYALCKAPDADGNYTRHDLDLYVPGLDGWTVTNVYDVVNGIDFYYNYAEIMGSRVEPYGTTSIDPDTGDEILTPEGFYVKGIPVFGYDYSRNDTLINNAVNALNDRKLYIDDAVEKCENSFGIDFKLFNSYGPGHVFYIINSIGEREFIDRVNITMKFRLKLIASNDSYTKNLIIKDVKDYMEDLNDLEEIHIPNLITLITNTYKESIVYFEFLGINDYGPGIQHLYKLESSQIPIHTSPEFININNIQHPDGTLTPDVVISVSE